MQKKRFQLPFLKVVFFSLFIALFLLIQVYTSVKISFYNEKRGIMGEIHKIAQDQKVAFFGLGCFWCSEAVFEHIEGVVSVESGYMGGSFDDPSYKAVSKGDTGHAEVIQIIYDPKKVSYEQLLSTFWIAHNPTTLNRQGADVGTQYRSIIFYSNNQEHQIALRSKEQIQPKFDKPIVTEIKKASQFYLAEQSHQDYYKNHSDTSYSRWVIDPKLNKLGLDK